MGRKILCILPLLLLLGSASALAQVSIGYMNVEEVLSQLPERQQIEQELNQLITQKQQELQQKATEFQNALAQYQQNQDVLSEQERQQRESELTEMQASLREFQQSIQIEIQQKRTELLQPVYDEIDAAIASIAEEMDLDFVLNEATSMGDNIVYYSSRQQLDITQQVVDQLKQ